MAIQVNGQDPAILRAGGIIAIWAGLAILVGAFIAAATRKDDQ